MSLKICYWVYLEKSQLFAFVTKMNSFWFFVWIVANFLLDLLFNIFTRISAPFKSFSRKSGVWPKFLGLTDILYLKWPHKNLGWFQVLCCISAWFILWQWKILFYLGRPARTTSYVEDQDIVISQDYLKSTPIKLRVLYLDRTVNILGR